MLYLMRGRNVPSLLHYYFIYAVITATAISTISTTAPTITFKLVNYSF